MLWFLCLSPTPILRGSGSAFTGRVHQVSDWRGCQTPLEANPFDPLGERYSFHRDGDQERFTLCVARHEINGVDEHIRLGIFPSPLEEPDGDPVRGGLGVRPTPRLNQARRRRRFVWLPPPVSDVCPVDQREYYRLS